MSERTAEHASAEERDEDAAPGSVGAAEAALHTWDLDEVFAREFDALAARRQAVGLGHEALRAVPGTAPQVARGVVGMAISGGGIRSSTFSLGVVQALEQADLFGRVDYVSTVSGGGYTGSMLSSLLGDPEAADQDFPLAKPHGACEPPALEHVRHCANYLDTGGLLGGLRLPMIVIRGLALNFLLFLPIIMLAVLFTEVAYEQGVDLMYRVSTWSSWLELVDSRHVALLVATPIVVLMYLLNADLGSPTWAQRDRREKAQTLLLLLGMVSVLLYGLGRAVGWAIEIPLYGESGAIARLDQLWSAHGFVALGVVLLLAVLFRVSARLSKIGKKLALVLVAILGPAAMFGFYLFLCIAQIDSPFMDSAALDAMAAQPGAHRTTRDVSSTASQELRRALLSKGIDYPAGEEVPALYCAANDVWMVPKPGQLGCPLAELCALDDSEIEASCGYRLRPRGAHAEVIGARLRLGGQNSAQSLMPDRAFALLALLLLVLDLLFIDINYSSPHGFYRDRLSRLFLIRTRRDGARTVVVSNDSQKLSELSAPGTRAPYQLINATLNLQGSLEKSARGRQSDVFFFSKYFCGSGHTGYGKTTVLEDWDPHLDLGSAMAISAAAASPNMGSMTLRPVVFIMTLFNVRLGYWMPNPLFLARRGKPPRWRARPRLRYLMREALGAVHDRNMLINVSDGGHLENLGAYQLLKRRVRVLIVVDGEADPTMSFASLVTLIRMARIDLGVEIDIDPSALELDERGRSRAHFALGTIDYGMVDGAAQRGHLVYIKSSLVGGEDLVVRKYKAEHPAFPHESTADQFFDEIQFEAYRALGAHVGEELARTARFLEIMGDQSSEKDA